MASQMASPQEGHLDALMNIFGFLRINHNSRMAYDPSNPTIDMSIFKPNDWNFFYENVEESIPSNAMEPRGKDIDLRWGEAHTSFTHGLLRLHEHGTRAAVLEATGHDRNLSFWSCVRGDEDWDGVFESGLR
jgi:hypothetical protein